MSKFRLKFDCFLLILFLLCRYGTQSVTISKFIPYIATLLSDQSSAVRDTACSTLVELYKHVGERLRKDLQKKNLIPSTRLPALLAKFDEVKEAGELLPTAVTAMERKYRSFLITHADNFKRNDYIMTNIEQFNQIIKVDYVAQYSGLRFFDTWFFCYSPISS